MTLDIMFYVLVVVFWSVYAAALSSTVYGLIVWDVVSGGYRLKVAVIGLAILALLTGFVRWAEIGQPKGAKRKCGLPRLNPFHWIYIGAAVIWCIYFAPVAHAYYMLFTWTAASGSYKLALAALDLGLVLLMRWRIKGE